MPQKSSWDWKSILSLAAMVTSLSALYVSYRQLRIASEEQQTSVFPYLTQAYNTSEHHVEMYLKNDGLGPAFISGVEVRVGDSTYDQFFKPVVQFMEGFPAKDKPFLVKSDLLPGWVIPANSTPWMVFRLDSLSQAAQAQYWNRFENMDAKIWYLDMYNNCWLFRLRDNRVERCPHCPNEVLRR